MKEEGEDKPSKKKNERKRGSVTREEVDESYNERRGSARESVQEGKRGSVREEVQRESARDGNEKRGSVREEQEKRSSVRGEREEKGR